MAVLHGKTAKIYWDASDTNTNLVLGQSWSVDITHDVTEITSMGNTWKTYITGMQDLTATVECLLDTTGAKINFGGDDGMSDDEACYLELYLNYAASDYDAIYGTAICTGISPGIDKDGVGTVTYTFQSNAQWKWHSAETEPSYE